MEHLHHFGLRQDPYQNEPDLRFYFDGLSHTAAVRRIERGLRQQKGLCVLTGEAGTGKSLLARRLLDGFEEEVFDAQLMLMMPGATDAGCVLSRYARMVGVEEPDSNRPALLAQIYEQLAIVREEGRHSVLMLDDAHLLSKDALAEIGGLLNLEYEDRRLVSLLLVGLPQLDVTLSHEASLGQRIDVRTRLEPFDFQNTTQYLKHRLTCAGGDPAILPDEALAALFKYGRGRPRLLNTVADNALFEAYLANRPEVNAHDVERAAGELGIGSEPGSTYSDVPQPAGHSGSSLPGAPGSTFELHEVAEPEFEVSSFDTGSEAPVEAANALLAADMPGEGEGPEEVGTLLTVDPEPEAVTAFDVDPLALEAEPMLAATPPEALPPLVLDEGLDGIEDIDCLEGIDDLDSAVEEMMNSSSGVESNADEAPSPFDLTTEFDGGLTNDGTNQTMPLSLEDDVPLEVAGEPEDEGELDDLFVELIEE